MTSVLEGIFFSDSLDSDSDFDEPITLWNGSILYLNSSYIGKELKEEDVLTSLPSSNIHSFPKHIL